MSKSRSKQKIAAWVLLIVFSVQTFYPTTAYALTSGPTTPEMTAFEPASTANMVDLFSGDFSYNIPLLDVGGYPVNISYHSGAGPEEEAGWVGFGWSLNPGAINRQLRGLPDDFKGDIITQEDNKKPNITVGGNINASIKLFGNRLPKIKIGKKKKKLDGSIKVKIGIVHNNYTGFRGMIGIGPGFGTSDDNSDALTKGLGPATSTDISASAGLNVDNQSGVNPYANFEVNYKIRTLKERQAEKDLFVAEKQHKLKTIINAILNHKIYDINESQSKVANLSRILNHESHSGASIGASSSINFNGYQPPGSIQTPMISKNFTASLSLGITLFGGTVSPGIEGTFSKQELKDQVTTAPAYGFMNSHIARAKEEAILDYNVEKESPYFKRLPNLGVTVFTPDLFSVTSNAGSMQFRPYLRGAGVYFQPHKHDEDKSANIGLEPAFGNIFHLGIPLQIQKTNNISGKWVTKNEYLPQGDFKSDGADPSQQAFYFKRVGEKNKQDKQYFDLIGNTSPVAVKIEDNFNAAAFGNGKATQQMRKNTAGLLSGNSTKTMRDKANHSITYLTAAEADKYALDKQLNSYTENQLPTAPGAKTSLSRINSYRKSHHISQYTITQDDGQRMVYGVPVYNIEQEEVSFAIPKDPVAITKGIATYTPGVDNSVNNTNGKDNFYHKYKTPSYTTGHLLSAILSPDYVDITGNGVSDDDLGTAVKFNYSLVNTGGEATRYKWRTPYTKEANNQNTANYNEGYESIPDDDKANYTYGEKELWYLHSIESKTMVAQFITSADREDAAGVVDRNGGVNGSLALRRLMEIRLYSKSDLYANPNGGAIPIKVVHFKYYDDYPLINGLPNNTHAGTKRGKLTLEKIWFTYGNNSKGQYNRYEFKYNIPTNNQYEDMQSDRWGMYRPKSANPNGLDNLEFPYATQNKTNADNFASAWQLSEIELPSGAVISVQYESDDYSYVQDRRAAQMCFITGIGTSTGTSGFATANKIYVKLPVAVSNADLKKRYFEGLKSLAYKAYVNLDGKGHWEYVSGYADIASYAIADGSGFGDVVAITVTPINGYNPIAKSAWQKLKLDLPRYAYPEYDNLDAEGLGFIKAIKALAATFGRFKDLVENFDHRAKRKGFGDQILPEKSWARLNTPIGINTQIKGKLGGGHRVKRIQITDKWATMSGVASAETGSYGQEYDYTIKVSGVGGATDIVSSGVASYEPVMGGDENPFHEPINYVDKHLFGLPKYFYLERPMGESYFPGASVGYSKVTVRNLGADGSLGETGSTVNEFYTAKDFPTKVDDLPMERKQPALNFLPSLFGAKLTSGVTVSQGYVVENNDMHGKQKAEAIYGRSGNEISSAKYFYKVKNPGAEKLDLDNNVSVVDKTGGIDQTAIVGMDIDMFTEMNESQMENMGIAIDPSFGITIIPPLIKISVKLPLPKPNYERRLYRGSSTIKLVNRYGILQKSVKTVSGSTNTAENLLWDSETGEVLLSKTNNEFNDDIYTFNYPAHWMYDGMGSAFRNEGVYLPGFTTDPSGKLTTTYNGLIAPGDEFVNVNGNNKYWVTNPDDDHNSDPVYPDLYLVDKDGKFAAIPAGTTMKIIRSGRRNLGMASVGTIVSMNNPIITNGSNQYLSFSTGSNVLQSNAVSYNQYWPMPVDMTQGNPVHYLPQDCGSLAKTNSGKTQVSDTTLQYKITKKGIEQKKVVSSSTSKSDAVPTSCLCTCLKKLFDYLIATQQLFIQQSQNKTVGQMVALANAAGYNVGSCSILDNNSSKPFYALTSNTTGTIYSAQIGECIVSIRSNNSNPVSFYNLVSQNCGNGPTVTYSNGGLQTVSQTFQIGCARTYDLLHGTINNNSPKIRAGSYYADNMPWDSLMWVITDFKIPGVSNIPTNATVVSANLHLFAAPDGFNPPAFTNAHTTYAQDALVPPAYGYYLNYILGPSVDANVTNPWNCLQPISARSGQSQSFYITNYFEDVVLDSKTMIQDIVSNDADDNFGLWIPFSLSPSVGPRIYRYKTFASNTYPNAAKRPWMDVVYTIPAASAPVATLTIDDCIASSNCENVVFNPYTTGVLGNWRVKKQLLFDTKRINNKGNVSDPTGTQLRTSGHFDVFATYWVWNSNEGRWRENPNSEPKWQWTSAASKFNQKGQEIENFDALDRYSAALHGYLQSLPTAVAGNAKYREIAYDGFEDYNFNLGLPNVPASDSCKIQDHFSFRKVLGAVASLDNTKAHTGKYSLKLTGTATIEKPMMVNEPASIYAIDLSHQYKLTNGYLRFGFIPVPSKKYIISGWVNDNQPKSPTINGFTFKVNNVTYNLNDNASSPSVFSKVHVVEGWKRFEMVITLPATGTFKLELGGTNINVDDIRIHPYDAQLKSFAYDASSLRLMAEMDENNFATFYEYDDEGTLVRVKKETEKGISTIKETRSSIRKKNL